MLPEAALISIACPPGPEPVLPPGVRIPLPVRQVFIGRYGPDQGVHFTLQSHAVSRHHACLRASSTGWSLRALGNYYLTLLNRARLPPQEDRPLADGDVIAIGDCWFLFVAAPFDRRWLTPDVVPLARGILADGAWDRLGMLGDALADAGCDWKPLLDLCSPTVSLVPGRWVPYYLLREAGEFDPVPSPLVVGVNDAARVDRFTGLPVLREHVQPDGPGAEV